MGGWSFDRGDARALGERARSRKRVDTDGSVSQNLEAITRWSSARASTSRAHARYHRQRERMCRDAGVRCFASHGTGRVMFGPSLRLNTL